MDEQSERVKVWDLPLRLFHWTLAIAIALAFLSSEKDSALNDWHVLSGWVAAVLNFRLKLLLAPRQKPFDRAAMGCFVTGKSFERSAHVHELSLG